MKIMANTISTIPPRDPIVTGVVGVPVPLEVGLSVVPVGSVEINRIISHNNTNIHTTTHHYNEALIQLIQS